MRGRSAPARRRARRLHQQQGGIPWRASARRGGRHLFLAAPSAGSALAAGSPRGRASSGDVETRLKKLDQGLADATLLALAGLATPKTLPHTPPRFCRTDEMLPAVAQGAIGVTRRESDSETRELLQPLDDHAAVLRVACERAFLARLEGSCKTPIAGLAVIEDGALALFAA